MTDTDPGAARSVPVDEFPHGAADYIPAVPDAESGRALKKEEESIRSGADRADVHRRGGGTAAREVGVQVEVLVVEHHLPDGALPAEEVMSGRCGPVVAGGVAEGVLGLWRRDRKCQPDTGDSQRSRSGNVRPDDDMSQLEYRSARIHMEMRKHLPPVALRVYVFSSQVPNTAAEFAPKDCRQASRLIISFSN